MILWDRFRQQHYEVRDREKLAAQATLTSDTWVLIESAP